MLFHAVKWDSGSVMCFDECGMILPALCGVYAEVQARVLEESTPQTMFAHATWYRAPHDLSAYYAGQLVSREDW